MKKRLLLAMLTFSCVRLQAVEPVTIAACIAGGVSASLWLMDKFIGWATHDPVHNETAHIQKKREEYLAQHQKVEIARYEELIKAKRAYMECKTAAEASGNNQFLGNTTIPLNCKKLAEFYAMISDLDTQEKIFKKRD